MARRTQTRRQGYNPKRTVNSTFARESRKNAEVFGITASGTRGFAGTLHAVMGAGLEPKHSGKRKVKSVLRKTSKSPTTKRVSGVKKTKTITNVRKSGRGGRGGGSGGGGGWATIDGRRIPLGG